MIADFITRAELEELVREFEARLRRVMQEAQAGGQVIHDNEDLSRILKVCPRTLQTWRDEGSIRFSQKGHKIYYTDEDVDDFLKMNRVN